MSGNHAPPPIRRLSPDRLTQVKQHLLNEIAHEQSIAATSTRLRGRFAVRALIAAATLALVTVVVASLVSRAGTDTASAAQVRAKLAEGLRFRQSVSGEFSVRTRNTGRRPPPGCLYFCAPAVPLPSRFVIGADGSYSSITLPLDATKRSDVAYDASTGVETRVNEGLTDPRTGRPLYLRSFNLDPAFLAYAPEAQLGAWVQAALANRNPRVKDTTFDGRSAWKLTVGFTPRTTPYASYGARVDVVVDKETGLVLQVTQYAFSTDRWTSIETVHDLKIGAPTSAADFTVPKPAGAVELSHDYGFRRVPVAAAAAIVGYRPLLPTHTLGYSLSDFAVAKTSRFPFPGIPIRHDMISARYGRGATVVTVSTWRGPVSELATMMAGPTLHLTRGPLAGDQAFASTSPLGPGVLVAFHDGRRRSWDLTARGLLVQITAPSAKDAIAIANSLRTVR